MKFLEKLLNLVKTTFAKLISLKPQLYIGYGNSYDDMRENFLTQEDEDFLEMINAYNEKYSSIEQ